MKIGKVSESVLKRSILRQLKTKREEVLCGAGVGDDCAIFALAEGEMLSTCVQEAAVAVQADMDTVTVSMTHLIQKCANNLAVSGAQPIAAMITLLLPETIEEPDIKKLMAEAEAACHGLNMQIAGGQTRVSAAVKEPLAVVTGYGKLVGESITECKGCDKLVRESIAECKGCDKLVQESIAEPKGSGKSVQAPLIEYRDGKKFVQIPVEGSNDSDKSGQMVSAKADNCAKPMRKAPYTAKAAQPGQDIVISKWIGLEGTAIAARCHKDKLLARYPAYLVEEAQGFDKYLSIIPEAATAIKSGVCAMHDASEGGIFAALWELAEGAGVGLTIDLKKLPLRQETVEVCECCNINPYELKSGGCLVMTAEDGLALVAALAAENIPAVVVGKLTDSNDRIIRNEEEVRYMDRPRTDEVYKL